LRTGSSTATAPFTGNKASRPAAEQDTRSSRLMRGLPPEFFHDIVRTRSERFAWQKHVQPENRVAARAQ
jgi:hypothetical protein